MTAILVYFLATLCSVVVFNNRIAASDPAQQLDAERASQIETRSGQTVDIEWPPTEQDRLLQQLKQRDAALENRNLQIIERSIELKDDSIIVKGTAQLLIDDRSSVELELDRDLIVRRAAISISSMPSGTDEYRVETSGIVRPEHAPAVAEHGNALQVLILGWPGLDRREAPVCDVRDFALLQPRPPNSYS